MPLFRRTPRPPTPSAQFTVGVRDNRVIVGAERPGIEQLDELRDYVGSVTGHAGPTPDGRDPVAVLNAKMDFAELVDDAAAMAALAFEELIARNILDQAEVPQHPELPPMPQASSTYDYIEAAYARAQARMSWLDVANAVLQQHDVALLPPLPSDDDQMLRARRGR